MLWICFLFSFYWIQQIISTIEQICAIFPERNDSSLNCNCEFVHSLQLGRKVALKSKPRTRRNWKQVLKNSRKTRYFWLFLLLLVIFHLSFCVLMQLPFFWSQAPTSVKPEVLSTRRLRVMQSLGLVGPSGSPFKKSGGICVSFWFDEHG